MSVNNQIDTQYLNYNLTNIANKIREKSNVTNELIFPEAFIEKINTVYISTDWLNGNKPSGEIFCNSSSVSAYLLYNRKNITKFTAPNAVTVGSEAFRYCTNLLNVYLPKLTTGNNYVFNGCSKLEKLILPSFTGTSSTHFADNCANLTTLDILGGKTIHEYAFQTNSKLSVIIIRDNSVTQLSFLDCLGGTAFASGKAGGTLYVPRDQIDNYKNATNWSTILSYTKSDGSLQNKILPIEESEYYTHYADGVLLPGAYVSSTGKEYFAKMEINISNQEVQTKLNTYGVMEHLEELTLTGTAKEYTTGVLLGKENMFSQTQYPALKKLYVQPTKFITSKGEEKTAISCGHYIFTGTNLTELVLGRVGGPYFSGGGYFRHGDMPMPPGTNGYQVGSADGLTITIYVPSPPYQTAIERAGFSNSTLAPNTTLICRDYTTGEIITPTEE